ncbi:hypothetical protein FQR65_LT13534 [Abscondita terminalis]|nr:hypothetical protein FQR65_LT13534 [Abscondita terminalis]
MDEFDAMDEIPLAALAEMQKTFTRMDSSNIELADFINLYNELDFEDDDVDGDDLEYSENCPLKNHQDAIAALNFSKECNSAMDEFDAMDEIPLAALAEMQKTFTRMDSSNIELADFINLYNELDFEDDDVDGDDLEYSENCPLKNHQDAIAAVKS